MKACLSEIAEFITDGTHGSPERTEIGVPVLSAQNVAGGTLSYSTGRYTSEAEYQAFKKRLDIAIGDVLLTIVGSIGRAAVVAEKRPAVFQRSVAVIRPKQQVADSAYLLHLFHSSYFQSELYRNSNQSSQAGVYLGRLGSIEIPLPPLEEQRRIAAILDKVALLIQSAAHAFFLSQELKKSLVHETLGLAREGDERVRIKVSEVADMITGFPFKSAQYTDKAQHTRLCRGINVLPDRIEWKQVARWPEITPELRSYQIDEDDILIAMDRPWITEGFKIARVKPIDIPSLLVQRVARIRAGNQILPPHSVRGSLKQGICHSLHADRNDGPPH